ncbi:MAG: CinA family protein [Deltaproteobacteria bacterium]|nr:CinA family protein [Deltaproteobacteria bacterium]
MEKLPIILGEKLRAIKATISTAESCTGGLIGHLITNVAGSSDYFERGVITYSNLAKHELIGVDSRLIEKHGAVSEQVAKAMAEGIKNNAKTTIGIGVTGIAGPTGGSKEKPIGTVFIGVATPFETKVKRFQFKGKRIDIKFASAQKALEMAIEAIEEISIRGKK